MAALEDAPIAVEIADVVDLVISYSFIFVIIKWEAPTRQKGVVRKLIFIKIGGPNKMNWG